MSQILNGKLRLSRIPKELVQEDRNGGKCIWVDILEKKEPDQFGYTHTLVLYDKENRKNIYLADLKPKEIGQKVDNGMGW